MNEYDFHANEAYVPAETAGAPAETFGAAGGEAFGAGGSEYFPAGGAETFVKAAPVEESPRAKEAARKRRLARQLMQKTGYLVASCVAVVMLATAAPDLASDFKWNGGSAGAYYADSVTAIVCNAVDRSPVAARMVFYDDAGRRVASAQANREGEYNVTLPAGEYSVALSAAGYLDDTQSFRQSYEGRVEQVFAMSASLQRGQMRIVLQWGEHPGDLDSHLFGRAKDGSYVHVYYSDMQGYSDAYDRDGNRKLLAALDVDDTSSYGPETITIYDLNASYVYAVYDYSSGGSLSSAKLPESGATIKVYTYGSDTPRTFELPRGEGTWWHVFRIENGTIRPIRELNTTSPGNSPDYFS